MHIDNVDLEHFPANEVAQRLLTYVTRGWYDKSYVGKWIFEVMGLELDTAIKRIEEAQSQSFPETAAWGMYFHELTYGIRLIDWKTLYRPYLGFLRASRSRLRSISSM